VPTHHHAHNDGDGGNNDYAIHVLATNRDQARRIAEPATQPAGYRVHVNDLSI
jgi:hypothetical protein